MAGDDLLSERPDQILDSPRVPYQEIVDGQDADDLVTVEDRQPAQSMVPEHLVRARQFHTHRQGEDIGRHHLPDSGLHRDVTGETAQHDIPISHNSDQTLMVRDEKRTHPVAVHLLRRFPNRPGPLHRYRRCADDAEYVRHRRSPPGPGPLVSVPNVTSRDFRRPARNVVGKI